MKIYKIKLLGQLIDLHNDDDHAKDRNYKNNKNTTIITWHAGLTNTTVNASVVYKLKITKD